jgi:hypothetical protein
MAENKLLTIGIMKEQMASKIAEGLNQLSLITDDEEEIM